MRRGLYDGNTFPGQSNSDTKAEVGMMEEALGLEVLGTKYIKEPGTENFGLGWQLVK